MRVLVTGATGFIGRRLMRKLLRDGHHICALVRSREPPEEWSAVRIVRGDIRRPSDVKKSLEGQEVVINLAAALDHLGARPQLYREVNVGGMRNLLHALRRRPGIKLIHVSTVGVHGPIEKPPADEMTPFRPVTVYDSSKAHGENLVWDAVKKHGLRVTVMRPAIVYGQGDVYSAIYGMFRAIARGRYRHIGDGHWLIHMVHVDDVVEGIMAAITAREAEGKAFILAGPEPISFRELAETIASALGARIPDRGLPLPLATTFAIPLSALKRLGVTVPLSLQSVRFLTTHHAYTIDQARAALTYQPRVDLQTGVQRTAEWYRVKGYIET